VPNRKVDRASVLYNMMMMMMLFCCLFLIRLLVSVTGRVGRLLYCY